MGKKALGAPEARKKWCQCADELGEMVSWEAKNNPRYKDMKNYWNEPPPPPPR
ncbi:MAG: hypothetical protein VW454_07175 [Pelagibacteraceae bacterium]